MRYLGIEQGLTGDEISRTRLDQGLTLARDTISRTRVEQGLTGARDEISRTRLGSNSCYK